MDKFVVRYQTSEEALPLVWKTSPLPRSKPKRPVGRPRKRQLDSEDINSSAKRVCLEDSDDSCSLDSTPTPSEHLDTTPTPSEHIPGPSVSSSESNTDILNPIPSENIPSPSSVTSSDASVSSSNISGNTNTSASNIRGNYKHFSFKQKVSVKEFAKLHGIRAAAKHFKIPRSTVNTWTKTDFTCAVRDKKGALPKTGRPLTYPEELDAKILEHVLEERDLQNAVSVDGICRYAAELIKPVSPGFAASRRWAVAFMKRHDLSLRAKTSLSQRLPDDLEEKLVSFHEFVMARREEDEFDDNLIINMDETPVYFDLVPSKTVNMRGSKSVLIRTTGSEKRHFTMVLAVAASGDVLPPMVIFKGKRELNIPTAPGWIVTVQDKGWMDESLMLRWIRDIYLKHTKKDRSLLVLDSFRGHITDSVKKACRKGNTVMAVIPGGCTSKVQPLDVSINKPFKADLRQSWGDYMRAASREARDKGERVKAATKETVLSWLVNAVKAIEEKPAMVHYSFLVCGISNKLDGSENDLIRKDIPIERKDDSASASASGSSGLSLDQVFADSDDEEEFDGFDAGDIPEIAASLDELVD